MKIAIIGTGYVGLVTGACLAEVGHYVICVDKDQSKIATLRAGGIPIHEEGLEELVVKNAAAGRLRFSDSLTEALCDAEIAFIAVGTPQGEDGSADLSYVLAVAAEIGTVMTEPLVVVQKSTCPVGTARDVEDRIRATLFKRGVTVPFAVVSNPEFLREGSAVRDFMQPDRVVIGADDEEAGRKTAALYTEIVSPDRLLIIDRTSAELTKYAANAFLATKISFINDIANLCELVGADVESVRQGIGSDHRIGPAFLAAGIGYGGSCFPKDVRALINTASKYGHSLRIVKATEAINREQRDRQIEKVIQYYRGHLEGKRIAIWGVAFKPGTDDMREAPAISVTRRLLDAGANVVAYDPIAGNNASRILDERVTFASDALTCVEKAQGLILLTEWPEFQMVSLDSVRERMTEHVIFDFRNVLNPASAIQAGFTYLGVGRGSHITMSSVVE